MADEATERNGRGRQMTQVFAPRKMPGTATGKAQHSCAVNFPLRQVILRLRRSCGVAKGDYYKSSAKPTPQLPQSGNITTK